jgi:hypothetical protein
VTRRRTPGTRTVPQAQRLPMTDGGRRSTATQWPVVTVCGSPYGHGREVLMSWEAEVGPMSAARRLVHDRPRGATTSTRMPCPGALSMASVGERPVTTASAACTAGLGALWAGRTSRSASGLDKRFWRIVSDPRWARLPFPLRTYTRQRPRASDRRSELSPRWGTSGRQLIAPSPVDDVGDREVVRAFGSRGRSAGLSPIRGAGLGGVWSSGSLSVVRAGCSMALR